MAQITIFILLFAMISSLAIGLRHLLKTPSENDNGGALFKALVYRIGIWVVLFSFILIALKMEWIEPSNSVNPVKFNQAQKQRMEKSAQ